MMRYSNYCSFTGLLGRQPQNLIPEMLLCQVLHNELDISHYTLSGLLDMLLYCLVELGETGLI